ncbi:MAG: aminoacyl-histidine dipeptidase [Desulfobacteraceae bacterium]|nr:aminoacyl-histidine dipeptidase [Desulfobacteraceae bacterium]
MGPEIARVLEYFERISAIPRCSRNEGRIGQWLREWALGIGYEVSGDPAGNLVVRVPASPGVAQAPTVVIQGHMDMVCEKTPDSPHDFHRDPIRCIQDGEWLRADRTTLGADNGIAIAYAMALVEDRSLAHPPLELLFTVDEETGLNGVKKLAPGLLTGRMMINLDSEDEGVFTIGCAGGRETNLGLRAAKESLPSDWKIFKLVVGGLRGGHSGIDIDKQRGNAIQLLARTLARIESETACRIMSIKGGTRHNAIARDAEAIIALGGAVEDSLKMLAIEMEQRFKTEYKVTETGLSVSVQACNPAQAWSFTSTDSQRLIRLLLALPHGVAGMSPTLAHMVETSNNLAKVTSSEDHIAILCSQRSALVSRLEEITAKVHAVATLAGATVGEENQYPPWPPNPDAFLLSQSQATYERLFGKAPLIQVIHAGLECAIIGDRYPGMQMISFGPTIQSPHSPSERLHIPSVEKVWRFLAALLRDLCSHREAPST